MRDWDRIQERQVVQVESRRLAHAAGLAVVFVVVAFYTGVQVGKRAAAAGAMGPTAGQSAALVRAQLAEEDAESEKTHYTFEDVLTAPDSLAAEASARGEIRPPAAWMAPPAPAAGAQNTGSGAEPAPAAKFTVQVKAFRDQSGADALARQLRANGYDAFVGPADSDSLYRVWVGRFPSTELAVAFQREFETREGFSTMVSSL